MPGAKKATAPKAATKRVRYVDSVNLVDSLAALGGLDEARWDMAYASRIALMRREAEPHRDSWIERRNKDSRAIAKAEAAGDADAVFELAEGLRTEGNKTFTVHGSLDFNKIKEVVGNKGAAKLPNIIAGLMPVLDHPPTLEDAEEGADEK